MNDNLYSWDSIHKLIDWIENYCTEHPNFSVKYRVKMIENFASIDLGDETYHFEGCFIASANTKKDAICDVLFKFLFWYKKFDRLPKLADDFLSNYFVAKDSGFR